MRVRHGVQKHALAAAALARANALAAASAAANAYVGGVYLSPDAGTDALMTQLGSAATWDDALDVFNDYMGDRDYIWPLESDGVGYLH